MDYVQPINTIRFPIIPRFDGTHLQRRFNADTSFHDFYQPPTVIPPWYHHLHLTNTKTVEHPVTALHNNATLILTTYSVTHFNLCKYGWILGTEHQDIIKGKGIVADDTTPSQLRSILTAIIAGITSFIELHNEVNAPIPPVTILVTSDVKYLPNIYTRFKNLPPMPSRQFHKEYNLLAILHELDSKYPSLFRLSKGGDVTIVTVKTCTNLAQHSQQTIQLPITQLPSHQVTITIDQQEATSEIESVFKKYALAPDLKAYFIKKYNWSNKIMRSIDWQIHDKAFQALPKSMDKFITQFIHGWIPTNKSHSNQNPITHKCPFCREEDETHQHFLQCLSFERKQIYQQHLIIFQDKITKLKLDPHLVHFSTLAITEWQQQPPSLPDRNYSSDEYRKLFHDQAIIGWTHFLKGSLSKRWVEIQMTFSQTKHSDSVFRISPLLKCIYEYIHSTWMERCSYNHGTSSRGDTYLRTHVLIPKVHHLYDKKSELNHVDQQYFDTPIENIIRKSTRSLRHWVTNTEQFFRDAMIRTNSQFFYNMKSIKVYFPFRRKIKARPIPTTQAVQRKYFQQTLSLSLFMIGAVNPQQLAKASNNPYHPLCRTERSLFRPP